MSHDFREASPHHDRHLHSHSLLLVRFCPFLLSLAGQGLYGQRCSV